MFSMKCFTHTHTYKHTHINTHAHTYTFTHTHTHAHTHIHTHAHTHLLNPGVRENLLLAFRRRCRVLLDLRLQLALLP